MRKIILALVGLLPLAGMAQSGYTISGKLSGLNVPAMAYLATVQGSAYKDKDSVEVKDGAFRFTGMVAEPEPALIAIRQSGGTPATQNDQLSFFLENTNISITGNDSIKNAIISGSVINKDKRELEASIMPLIQTISKLNHAFRGKPKDEAFKKASDSVSRLVAEIKDNQLKFVESHLNSFMGLYTFNINILDAHFDPATAAPLFHQFSPALQSSPLGKRTLEKIEIAKRRQTGIKATDFTQLDINGKPFKLSSLKGKYILVDFWASWCAPCRAENPNLLKAYQQMKGKNFEVVGVSLDQDQKSWEYAVKTDQLPWIHVCDLKGWKNEVAEMYGITAVPQNLLIDPEGVIIAKNLHGEDLITKLSALIK
ncbi:Peroxiredoxin [Chitinophaga costaii]|uniref:Peroxiredoxin n=1 Tax=Chitinophaga costaii TaxID=1335309 RepID=A0A1C4CV21_9BACT|nr:TlpA disulfide reductase family protein [Chitinophaga costaii]PUZ26931.1 AhpC/TSA family protein [Chitinophaga costaii]SCC22985.1 Peroxiredoxin [Chitinophaga costaii]